MTMNSGWKLLLNIRIEDVRYAKKQQWQVTYYALLLLAGIVAIYDHVKPVSYLCQLSAESSPITYDIFKTISLCIAVISSYLLADLNCSAMHYRTQIQKAKGMLGVAFIDYAADANYTKFSRDGEHIFTFIGITWISSFLISFVVIREPTSCWVLVLCAPILLIIGAIGLYKCKGSPGGCAADSK